MKISLCTHFYLVTVLLFVSLYCFPPKTKKVVDEMNSVPEVLPIKGLRIGLMFIYEGTMIHERTDDLNFNCFIFNKQC